MTKATAHNLEKMTLAYWKVSQAFNGTSEKPMSYSKAITTIGRVKDNTDPKRLLSKLSHQLSYVIILGDDLAEPGYVKQPHQH